MLYKYRDLSSNDEVKDFAQIQLLDWPSVLRNSVPQYSVKGLASRLILGCRSSSGVTECGADRILFLVLPAVDARGYSMAGWQGGRVAGYVPGNQNQPIHQTTGSRS